MEALSEDAKKVLSGLSAQVDALLKNPVQVPYEEMDPVKGGVFQDSLEGVNPQDIEDVIEELLEEKLVIVSSRERLVASPTIWPTNKGLVEGRKVSLELRKEEKEAAQKDSKNPPKVVSQRVSTPSTPS